MRYMSVRKLLYRVVCGCLAAGVGVSLSGCGGSTSSSSTISTVTPKTAVQVNMGDAPADWMLAFSMNISSMSLTGAGGSTAVISSPVTMEMLHLMGTMQPLAMVNVPQGTYTGATITIGSATMMYMDPASKTAVQKTIAGPVTGTVTFSTPVTVGSTPMAIGFDLDLANSVALNAAGAMTMTPTFHTTSGMQGAGNAADPANGGIQQMMGVVAGVTGSSFGMTSLQAAQNFTFSTNGSTVFSGTSMSGMANGMPVLVNAMLQPDGSLMATKVQSMGSAGAMGGGVMTAVTGVPATAITIVMQNGAGIGMMASNFAAGVTVTPGGTVTYAIDTDGINMTGLPFTPVFDGSHVYAGQCVMPVASAGMTTSGMGGMMGGSPMAGSMTASQIVLEQQGLSGTVATAINAGVSGSFTLTLPAGSAFTTLTGATTVMVFQQTQTTMAGASQIAAGSTMHAFGLLFYEGGQWKMVASRLG